MFMTLRDQVKVYHWQTKKYARHVASDELVKKLDTNIDQFVEVFVGKYGRPIFAPKHTIRLHNYHESEAPLLIQDAIAWLQHDLPAKLKKTDTDLLNIRDTIVADLNQTLYLFTQR
jgi:DNA-binding ferritin-like protein